jgi:REP-associated tyrosine transposase
MSRYRRIKTEGGTFFFTVSIADRSDDLLVRHINLLRQAYSTVQKRYPFETIAICILPDHLHAVWSLPSDDADYSLRWSLIKSGFSRKLPRASSLAEQDCEARKGLWQRRYWEHVIRDEGDLARTSITSTSIR